MAREYCCCAVPMINVGVYFALLEQLVAAAVAGTLVLATPSIVSYNAPSVGIWIFAAVCYVLAAVQLLGFIGVARQKSALFSRYIPLNALLLLAAFAVAATFIGISAGHHSAAVTACQRAFYSTPEDPTGTDNSASQTICNIFAWVGIGCLGGLWVIMGIMQSYMYSVVSSYASAQRADKAKYHSLQTANASVAGGPNDIQLADRGGKPVDPWDTRPENGAGRGAHGRQNSYGQPQPHSRQNSYGQTPYGQHARQMSAASNLPPGAAPPRSRQPTVDQYADPYAQQAYAGYAPQAAYGAYPPQAHTATEAPTPQLGGFVQRSGTVAPVGAGSTVVTPEQTKYHPAEGSFGRKTPRTGEQPYAFKSEYAHSSSSQGSDWARRG